MWLSLSEPTIEQGPHLDLFGQQFPLFDIHGQTFVDIPPHQFCFLSQIGHLLGAIKVTSKMLSGSGPCLNPLAESRHGKDQKVYTDTIF